MILTVEKKKKFLITMLVIMGCAVAINYGLYNVLNPYFKTMDNGDTYTNVQWNMITVAMIIGIVTVIMVVLIPKDAVNELMTKVENNSGAVPTGAGGLLNGGNDNGSSSSTTDEQKLQDMIDEELENNGKK